MKPPERTSAARKLLLVNLVVVAVPLLIVVAVPTRATAPLSCPPPGAPPSFWGYVTLNDASAPIDLKVAAWIDGVEVASTSTQSSAGATYYLLDVPARAYDTFTGEVCRARRFWV